MDFLAYIGVDRPSTALQQIKLLNESVLLNQVAPCGDTMAPFISLDVVRYRQLDIAYKMMSFELERNFGAGVLSGLDTGGVSNIALKKHDSDVRYNIVLAHYLVCLESG